MKYAQFTNIDASRSLAEITQLIERAGASQFMHGWDEDKGKPFVSFTFRGERCNFFMDLPSSDSDYIRHTRTGRLRRPSMQETILRRAINAAWRAMVLQVRAKLTALENRVVVQEERG